MSSSLAITSSSTVRSNENQEKSSVEKTSTKKANYQPLTTETVEKIKAILDAGKLSQEQAAKECNLSRYSYAQAVHQIKEGKDPTKKRSGPKMTEAIRKKIKALLPQLNAGDILQEKVAAQLEISPSTLKIEMQRQNEQGDDSAPKKSAKKTAKEISEQVTALLPQVEDGSLTLQQAAKKTGTSSNTFAITAKKLQEGKDPTQAKSRQKITEKVRDKIKSFLPQYANKEMTLDEIAEKCDVSTTNLRRAITLLKKGEDPAKPKARQKVTPEIQETVKSFLPQLKDKQITLLAVSEKCGATAVIIQRIVKKLEKGEDATENKACQRVTPTIRKKVEALLPKIKNKEMTCEEVGEECGISKATVKKIVKQFENGVVPAKRIIPKKVTEETQKKVEALLPKIKAGELTYTQAAEQSEIPFGTFQMIAKKLDQGIDPTQKKARTFITEAIREQVRALLPQVAAGKLTHEQVAKKCSIAQGTAGKLIKELNLEKAKVDKEKKAEVDKEKKAKVDGEKAEAAELTKKKSKAPSKLMAALRKTALGLNKKKADVTSEESESDNETEAEPKSETIAKPKPTTNPFLISEDD